MKWRAWLYDRRQFVSTETLWVDLPQGVVGVVEYFDPPYRNLHHNHDWIWLDENGFHRVPMHPVLGRWAAAPDGVPIGLLKRGANLSDAEWGIIQQEMLDAREAP